MHSLEGIQLRTLITQTDVGIAACNRDGRLTMLSPGLERLLGIEFRPFAEDQLVDRFDLYDVAGERRLAPEEIPLMRARHGETVRDAVICARDSRGGLVHLRCHAAPVHDDSGELSGAIVLVEDVSAEWAAVRQQHELRDRLVSTINHQLRTPLTSLVGHTELLADRAEEVPEDLRRSLAAVTEAGARVAALLQTVTELVDLDLQSRLTRGPCDLGRLVCEEVDRWQERARGRGLAFVGCPTAGPEVVIDGARARRAVEALLDNAVTYAPSGSRVHIAVEAGPDWVQVVVADEGEGIAPEDRDRLLQPFERGRHPRQDVAGRGLGLAVAKTVATAHGGQLTLSARHPSGLRAALCLPRDLSGSFTAP